MAKTDGKEVVISTGSGEVYPTGNSGRLASKERRKFPRLNVRMPIEIRMRRVTQKGLAGYRGQITDVAESGLRVMFSNGVAVAPTLTLHMTTLHGASLQFEADCVWSFGLMPISRCSVADDHT